MLKSRGTTDEHEWTLIGLNCPRRQERKRRLTPIRINSHKRHKKHKVNQKEILTAKKPRSRRRNEPWMNTDDTDEWRGGTTDRRTRLTQIYQKYRLTRMPCRTVRYADMDRRTPDRRINACQGVNRSARPASAGQRGMRLWQTLF